MKRSRAVALLLLGLCLVGGYAVWCARPFYRYPSLSFGPGISAEMQAYLTAWDAEQRLYRPVAFTWKAFGHALCHPYEPGFKPVGAMKIGGGLFEDEEEVIVSHVSRPPIQFRRDRYGWEPPNLQFPGPAGFVTRGRRWSPPDRSAEEEMPESFRMPPPVLRPNRPSSE
jgi:hypothetical protein